MTTFYDFARAHGVELPLRLDESDRIRRCATTEHPRSKNGAYRWDGRRGWVFAWDGDGVTHWFGEDRKPAERTEAEKQAWRRRREAEERRLLARRQSAEQQARGMLASAKPDQHGYLQRKGFPSALGLVLPDGALFVPMRDLMTNALRGGQVIRWVADENGKWAWEKKMLLGMRAQGAVLRLGAPKAAECVLVEGYATGLSVEAAVRQLRLNASVLVCFSDSNLVHVAPLLRGKAYVYADNDKSGAGLRAAQATGLPYCMSNVVGEDANDLHKRAGLFAVCAQLMQARTPRVAVAVP